LSFAIAAVLCVASKLGLLSTGLMLTRRFGMGLRERVFEALNDGAPLTVVFKSVPTKTSETTALAAAQESHELEKLDKIRIVDALGPICLLLQSLQYNGYPHDETAALAEKYREISHFVKDSKHKKIAEHWWKFLEGQSTRTSI
jgi:hypothetical protein